MSFQNFGICITAVISIISLLLSIANFHKSIPKLKIQINNKKWDCFFGKVMPLGKLDFINNIAGAKINIINNSPVAITISDIHMVVNNEKLPLINKDIDCWNEVVFVYRDNDAWTNDGSAIWYKDNGLMPPFKLNAYDTLTAYVLFNNFPSNIDGHCNAKIEMDTAIGKITKSINLIEYNKNYLGEDYRDYIQYCRSIEKTNK